MSSNNAVWTFAVSIIPLVIAIVFHEVAHGLAARALGDPTAEERRRLSFNPLRHVDPIGTVLLPVLLKLSGAPVFGWAKPVPVDPNRVTRVPPRTGMMIVALAGPGMNLALAFVAAIAIGLYSAMVGNGSEGPLAAFLAANLVNFLMINVFLAIFNLIPLPPFDGGHVVAGLLPERAALQWDKLARFGFPLLIVLLLVVPSIWPSADVVQRFVAPPAQALIQAYLRLAAMIA